MNQTTILHLSDLHISMDEASGGKTALQRQVFRAFWNYLATWKGSETPLADIVFVTGDVTRTGDSNEFGNTSTRSSENAYGFLNKLCKELSISRSRVFLTPGNHDVDRQSVNQWSATSQLKVLKNQESLANFFFSESATGIREEVFRRLRPFCEFSSEFTGQKLGKARGAIMDFVYKPRVYSPANSTLKIGVVNACTSWLCQSHYIATESTQPELGVATGRDHDREPPGWTALCVPKLEEVIINSGFPSGLGLRVATMHHPVSWLVDWEQASAAQFLSRNFHLVLTGHIHRSEIYLPQLMQTGHTVASGALFLNPTHRNSFNVLQIHSDNGTPKFARLRVVEWNETISCWENKPWTQQISERHNRAGYNVLDGWLQIPLSDDIPPFIGTVTPVNITLESASHPAGLSEQIRCLIGTLATDIDLKPPEVLDDGRTLVYRVNSRLTHHICAKLGDSNSNWLRSLAPLGIRTVEVGGVAYNLGDTSQYVGSSNMDDRRPRLTTAELTTHFNRGEGDLWRTLGSALDEMFVIRCVSNTLTTESQTRDPVVTSPLSTTPQTASHAEFENLVLETTDADKQNQEEDWGWYCDERLGQEGCSATPPEELLLRYLQCPVLNGTKKVVLVYGGTGHGKTTFIRHFFRHHLRQVNPELHERLVAIRFSLGISGTTIDSLEDDVDNKVNAHLSARFPFLYNDEHMLAMADLCGTMDTDFFRRLREQYPMGESPATKLQWINAVFGQRSVQPECNNPFSDFNRIRIQYLTVLQKRSFIFVFDNIDQMPRALQEAAFILARHKLEWVADTNDVTIMLAMRSYMVTRAAKELPFAAYQNRIEIRIQPPPLRTVLRRRIRYVTAKLPPRIKFSQNKIMAREVPIEASRQTVDRLLEWCCDIIGNLKSSLNLHWLTNGDMREQLRMVKAILTSPNYDWARFLDVLANAESKGPTDRRTLDLLLRGENWLSAANTDIFFVNLFDAAGYQHFANTLNRLYVLRLLKTLQEATVDTVVYCLSELKHPPAWTRRSLDTFLKRNVLISPDGQYLNEDGIKTLSFSFEGATIGRVYTDLFPFELYYLQAMSFTTPVVNRLRNMIRLPQPHEHGYGGLEKRLVAAAALIRQVDADEKAQWDAIKGNNFAEELIRKHGLLGIASSMAECCRKDIESLEGKFGMRPANWQRILDAFTLDQKFEW